MAACQHQADGKGEHSQCQRKGRVVRILKCDPPIETRSGDPLPVMVFTMCQEHANQPHVLADVVEPKQVRADHIAIGDILVMTGRLFPIRYAATSMMHLEGDSRPTRTTVIGIGSFSLGADSIEYSYARPWAKYRVIR